MDVPLKLLLGNEAKGRGGGAVPAPGVKINEVDSAHGQAFSHSLRCSYNLAVAGCPTERPAKGGACGAGVPPAVAGASRSRARATPVLSGAMECPRDSGRDARTTAPGRHPRLSSRWAGPTLLGAKGTRL